MVNLILVITAIPVLVLLYFQWKINGQQEQFIKAESESLRLLKETNQKYNSRDLFGLSQNSPYINTPASQPRIVHHRQEILTKHVQRNRSRKIYQAY